MDYITTVLFVRFLLHLSLWKVFAAYILNTNSNYLFQHIRFLQLKWSENKQKNKSIPIKYSKYSWPLTRYIFMNYGDSRAMMMVVSSQFFYRRHAMVG
jgi:hypothetical protein